MFLNLRKFIWFVKSQYLIFIIGKFGNFSYLAPGYTIIGYRKLFIGNKVRISFNLRAEAHGNGSIYINDNVSIGNDLHLSSFDDLIIEKNVTISSRVFIGSLVHSYEAIDVHIMNQKLSGSKTIIGENSFLGTGAVILPGTTLGKQCIVGANSVVKGDFGNYQVLAGNPARVIKQFNIISNKWEKC